MTRGSRQLRWHSAQLIVIVTPRYAARVSKNQVLPHYLSVAGVLVGSEIRDYMKSVSQAKNPFL